MADFVRVEMADGSFRTDLTRLTDGHVMCCHCFEYKTIEQLTVDLFGEIINVCIECHIAEQTIVRDRWCHVSKPHDPHGPICLGYPRPEGAGDGRP